MWKFESEKSDFPSVSFGGPGLATMNPYDIDTLLTARRNKEERDADAWHLPRVHTYGNNSTSVMNQKNTCIWSGGGILSWTEALHGIMWVAVHGIDSICVVTRIKDLEHEMNLRMAMLKERKPKTHLRVFMNGLISKVEGGGRRISDFVDPSTKHRRLLHQIIVKPYGVVSVIPDTNVVGIVNGHKAVSAKYDEENAIKFLQKEMESGADFTFDKTIQTAIRALGHLFRHEFQANEMQVFVWEKDDGVQPGQPKLLPRFRKCLDIEEHLAIINKPDSCASSSGESHEESITRF